MIEREEIIITVVSSLYSKFKPSSLLDKGTISVFEDI